MHEQDKQIPLQIARDEISRIDSILQKEHLLIGGVAVNKYVAVRQSKDIDLVCEYETAVNVIDQLYPSHEYRVVDDNDNAHRPSFIITKLVNEDFQIFIGPKILERRGYNYINWEDLLKRSIPYSYQGRVLKNIRIPCCTDLAFMKLISYLGRSHDKKDKRMKDLKDLRDLSNHSEFSTSEFMVLIAKTSSADYIRKTFKLNDEEHAIFSHSSIQRAFRLFNETEVGLDYNKGKHTCLTEEESIELQKKLVNIIKNPDVFDQRYSEGTIGIFMVHEGCYGVRVGITCSPPIIPPSIVEQLKKESQGALEINAMTTTIQLSTYELKNKDISKTICIGSVISNDSQTAFGKIGGFLRDTKTEEIYLVFCSHGIRESNDETKQGVYWNGVKIATFNTAKESAIKNKAYSIAKLLPEFHRLSDFYSLKNGGYLQGLAGKNEISFKQYVYTANHDEKKFASIEGMFVQVLIAGNLGQREKYKDLIEVLSESGVQFAIPGDSGTLVITSDNKAVGIIFASSFLNEPAGASSLQKTILIPFHLIVAETGFELITIPQPSKIFFSYNIRDSQYASDLKRELTILEKIGLIEISDYNRESFGENWISQITEKLNSSDIIVCLVSSNYLSNDLELIEIIKQGIQDKNRVLPIWIERNKPWESLLSERSELPYWKTLTSSFKVNNINENVSIQNLIVSSLDIGSGE